jgi:hypothetical protein
MATTTKEFLSFAPGNTSKQAEIVDVTGKLHQALVIKQTKDKKNSWFVQIEDYDVLVEHDLRKEAVEAFEQTLESIGRRTPEQYKYSETLSKELSSIRYDLKSIRKYFERNEEKLKTSLDGISIEDRTYSIVDQARSAAVYKSIKWLGDSVIESFDRGEEQYADDAIEYVRRIVILIEHFQDYGIDALTRCALRPNDRHFDDKYNDQAYAHFLGDTGMNSCKYSLRTIKESATAIDAAERALLKSGQQPHELDHWTTAKAFKKDE